MHPSILSSLRLLQAFRLSGSSPLSPASEPIASKSRSSTESKIRCWQHDFNWTKFVPAHQTFECTSFSFADKKSTKGLFCKNPGILLDLSGCEDSCFKTHACLWYEYLAIGLPVETAWYKRIKVVLHQCHIVTMLTRKEKRSLSLFIICNISNPLIWIV